MGQAKDSGQLDMSWTELADIINRECRNDELEYRTEAAYRKSYTTAKRFFDAGVLGTINQEDNYFKELQIQKDAVYKEKKTL